LTRLIVQIYEIQTPPEAEAVVAAGVDHVGSVVLSEENWKTAELKEAIGLVRAAGARSSLIPLFQTETSVLRALEFYQPDIVHFCDALAPKPFSGHGCERLIELQIRVKSHFPAMGVMRSIPIAPVGEAHRVPTLEYGRIFEPVTDFFLTDTLLVGSSSAGDPRQPVIGFVGITGQTCDWVMAGRLVRQSRIPVILAGGISPANAAEAIARTQPAGIDSCTLTNACDARGRPIRFRKDLEKVRALVAAVRFAESTATRIAGGLDFRP
jgi:phosphoribosylanthranilate isomerase